jgi:hypothetical protein
MDLNDAIQTAESGGHVRDDATMSPDWTVRYVVEKKLLYYFTPKGEQAHRVYFSDAQRASCQWRTYVPPLPKKETRL